MAINRGYTANHKVYAGDTTGSRREDMVRVLLQCPECDEEFVVRGRYDNGMDDEVVCPECGLTVSKFVYNYIREVTEDEDN